MLIKKTERNSNIKARGYTKVEIARKLGVSRQYVHMTEQAIWYKKYIVKNKQHLNLKEHLELCENIKKSGIPIRYIAEKIDKHTAVIRCILRGTYCRGFYKEEKDIIMNFINSYEMKDDVV